VYCYISFIVFLCGIFPVYIIISYILLCILALSCGKINFINKPHLMGVGKLGLGKLSLVNLVGTFMHRMRTRSVQFCKLF